MTMQHVQPRQRTARSLVVFISLALPALLLLMALAAPDAMAGQSLATSTPTPAGHAAMDESAAHAAGASHEGMSMPAADDHALPAPTASAGHADESEHESPAAHGHEDEAPSTTASTRGLVLGGFGAVNGLVIVGALISKTRIVNKAQAGRASSPETTTKGTAQ